MDTERRESRLRREIMVHEVTFKDVVTALDKEIPIVFCFSTEEQASKSLTFNPASDKYTVKYDNIITGESSVNSYLNVLKAIAKYNSEGEK